MKPSTSKIKKKPGRKSQRATFKREQPRKDSESKRVNLDNVREDKVREAIDRSYEDHSGNDITWYSKNETLMKAAASLPYGTILGDTYAGNVPVAGVMSFGWQPTIGVDEDVINQSFNSQYSYNVHANSRNTSYDSPDLGIIEIAGIEVFNIIGSMERAYGTAKYYIENNMYFPSDILTAQGFNPTDVQSKLSTMWFDINNLIERTKQIWIPNVMPVADRWMFLNSNIFSDANATQAQNYIFVQDTYMIYSETQFNTGGSLLPVDQNGEPITPDKTMSSRFDPSTRTYTWTQWMNVANAMIDALLTSQDRGIMYGDLLKAYGPEGIRSLMPIPVDFTVAPSYNQEMLMQIENLMITSARSKGIVQYNNKVYTAWDEFIIQQPNDILNANSGNPQIKTSYANDMFVLNFHFPTQPRPEDVVIATRAKSIGLTMATGVGFGRTASAQVSDTSKAYRPMTCGSEIFHSIKMYIRKYVSTLPTSRFTDVVGISQYMPNIDNVVESAITEDMNGMQLKSHQMGALMAFDWHPFIYATKGIITVNNNGTPANPSGNGGIERAFGDFDNYAEFNFNVLNRLHAMCLYSLFGVPQM
nr:capsid protein [Rat picobirnavirus]